MRKILSLVTMMFIIIGLVIPGKLAFANTQQNNLKLNFKGKALNTNNIEKVKINDLKLNNKNLNKKSNINTENIKKSNKKMNSNVSNALRAQNDNTNNQPVANLAYAILNPESEVNGNITTNTQIAWLMSYNGTNYTYDPNGNAITNMNISGIPQGSIIKDIVDSNNNIVGFITQFNIPAQYIMSFQVQDSTGAYSNIFQATIPVESANGTVRPVCNLDQSIPQSINAGQVYNISWNNSIDSNSSASITNGEVAVIPDGSIAPISDDIITNSKNYNLAINQAGNYDVMVRVQDSNNAWSNWIKSEVTVNSVNLRVNNVTITSNIADNYDYSGSPGTSWFREADACKFINTYGLPASDGQAVYDKFSSDGQPIPGKILDGGFKVQGSISDSNGIPQKNQEIVVTVPLPPYTIQKKAITDSNGQFTIQVTQDEFANYQENSKYYDTDYTFFDQTYNTFYMQPSKLQISAGGNTISNSDVIVVMEFLLREEIMAKRWIYEVPAGQYIYQWVQLPNYRPN